jgi:hypothetical protein
MEAVADSRLDSWPRCPEAAEFFNSLFRAFAAHNPDIAAMADRLLEQTGVPLPYLIDHWTVPPTYSLTEELTSAGLELRQNEDGDAGWEHPQARLPRLRVDDHSDAVRMAIAVEDLRIFAECNDLPVQGQHGDPDSGYEEARYPLRYGDLAVIARRGYRGFRPGRLTAADERVIRRVREALRTRSRDVDGAETAERTSRLIESLKEEVEGDRLTDEFFTAEREYYMERNRAARWQYQRQQHLGIGWANHDHHTYRSSRGGFRGLINLWLQFGFEAREKFYAGAEAGWGAQILEHPVSRVVLFCDVDMAPEEVNVDFSLTDLPPLKDLGTIGLWCGLHSESIAAAGLHHLEAEFDYTRVRDQLRAAGFGVMPPFTDLPMLKQAFTEAEIWPVAVERGRSLYELGLITAEQRDRFQSSGAPGSHLEILQRWDGFKGFNKTGINSIIRHTDARLVKSFVGDTDDKQRTK